MVHEGCSGYNVVPAPRSRRSEVRRRPLKVVGHLIRRTTRPMQRHHRRAPLILAIFAALMSVGMLVPAAASATGLVSFRARPAALTTSSSATLTWRSAKGVTYTCKFDGRVRTCRNRRLALTGLSSARHTVIVVGRRGAMRTVIRHSWTVDRVAPAIPSVTGGSSTWSDAASVRLVATSADALSGLQRYEVRTSSDAGAVSAPRTAAAGVLDITAEGVTRAQFRAIDRAGNASAWSSLDAATSRGQLDRTEPDGISLTPTATLTNAAPELAATPTDAHSGVASVHLVRDDTTGIDLGCDTFDGVYDSLDDSDPSFPYADGSVTGSGCVRYQLVITDVAGNIRIVTSDPIRHDDIAPGATTLTAPASNPGSTSPLSGTTGDDDAAGTGVSSVSVTYDDGAGHTGTACTATPAPDRTWSCDWNSVVVPDGSYTLSAVTVDAAGNESTPTTAVETIDNPGPVITGVHIAFTDAGVGDVGLATSPTVTSTSGPVTIVFQSDGIACGPGTFTDLPGPWLPRGPDNSCSSVRFVATDSAGNSATSAFVFYLWCPPGGCGGVTPPDA